jgi:hypothetical protein
MFADEEECNRRINIFNLVAIIEVPEAGLENVV